jgi:hypothetical protein
LTKIVERIINTPFDKLSTPEIAAEDYVIYKELKKQKSDVQTTELSKRHTIHPKHFFFH